MNFLALTVLTQFDDYLFSTLHEDPVSELIKEGELKILGKSKSIKLSDIIRIETTTSWNARFKIEGNRFGRKEEDVLAQNFQAVQAAKTTVEADAANGAAADSETNRAADALPIVKAEASADAEAEFAAVAEPDADAEPAAKGDFATKIEAEVTAILEPAKENCFRNEPDPAEVIIGGGSVMGSNDIEGNDMSLVASGQTSARPLLRQGTTVADLAKVIDDI